MKTNDYSRGCAEMLTQLRERKKLSISAMANAVNVDAKTWKRYEEGISAPSVPELLRIFNEMEMDVFKAALHYIYPNVYASKNANDVESMRRSCVHFMQNVATEEFIKCWCFLAFGNHGSAIAPQIQEFVMIDHLPLKYRIVVAEMVSSLYQLATLEGNLVNNGIAMPDIRLFNEAIEKAKQSVIDGAEGYSAT